MTTTEIVLLICVAVVAVVVLANIALEFIARRRHPPLGKFIELEGVRLHYLERGPPDGPVLVMLHGNGTLLQDLALSGLVDAAAQKFRVICFDRPGFGHSSRPRSVIWSPDRQGQLLCDLEQTWRYSGSCTWTLVGNISRSGNGCPQQPLGTWACSDLRLLLSDMAGRRDDRERWGHSNRGRHSALHGFADIELARPAPVCEESVCADIGAGHRQAAIPTLATDQARPNTRSG
jgi:alpha/beta hydrolase family protein